MCNTDRKDLVSSVVDFEENSKKMNSSNVVSRASCSGLVQPRQTSPLCIKQQRNIACEERQEVKKVFDV